MYAPKLTLIAILTAFASVALADMTVVFPDYEKFADPGYDFMTESTIPGDFDSPEGVVAAILLIGDQVKNKKLSVPFTPSAIKSTSHFEGSLPLGSYFRGARIEKKETFVIAFSGGAMRYLNNTAAIQQLVKGAIEETVKANFPEIKAIVYEIDGEIVEDWDA